MESKSAKYAFWSAVIAAVITGGIGLSIHLDGKAEERKVAEAKKAVEQSKDTANLTISNVYAPPINTSIESVFFAQVENSSLNIAKYITIKINFGKSSVSKSQKLPDNKFGESEKFNSSIVTFSAGDLQRKDSLYIYCLISQPVFDSILINGSNLFSNELFEFKQLNPISINNGSGFVTFFKVTATIVAMIFIGYFTIVIISTLNKNFKVDTSNL